MLHRKLVYTAVVKSERTRYLPTLKYILDLLKLNRCQNKEYVTEKSQTTLHCDSKVLKNNKGKPHSGVETLEDGTIFHKRGKIISKYSAFAIAPPRYTYGCGKLRKLTIGLVILAARVVMYSSPPATGFRYASTSIWPYFSNRCDCSRKSS